MEIKFEGKFKSITSFNWAEIPEFVVITGPNGTGKSQLLELIHNTIVDKPRTTERVSIGKKTIRPNEVIFLKGEWELQNTQDINLSTIQHQLDSYYNNSFRNGQFQQRSDHNPRIIHAYYEVIRKAGKQYNLITKDEFYEHFPEALIQNESELSQKIGEIFYNYRLSEIELQAKKETEESIKNKIGEKPWVVLRDIIRESKLPFDINDPSTKGIRDVFQLTLTHQILNEKINFNDLSSGEKVLISLVFYLYNSQEKKVFPRLMLLDEPDAHLHPSMSQQFLNVVKNVLVDKLGVQVIMTTHSPSTVILAPSDSIYEMSRIEPRIRKSPSKNHSVSLLTTGLVYVGDGTRYFLVEDKDDANFYAFVLAIENLIDSSIPLVFIPASTNDKSGGKSVVQNWVNKLQESGLVNIIQGLIDADCGNAVSSGVYKIDRYSIENYLADPILVYAALIDKEQHPLIQGLKLNIGEEYKLKSLSNEQLQQVADVIISMVEPELKSFFSDFNVKELERIEVQFTNRQKLNYPKWLINRRGKTILNEVYGKVFKSQINFSTLFKALKKINLFSMDIVYKFNEIKNGELKSIPK